jgi:hypothetical protein
MHTAPALPLGTFSFGSRRRQVDVVAAVRLALHRCRIRTRIEAIAAVLCDLKFNPFLFQIESSR